MKEYTFVQGHFEAEFAKAKNQVGIVFGKKPLTNTTMCMPWIS